MTSFIFAELFIHNHLINILLFLILTFSSGYCENSFLENMRDFLRIKSNDIENKDNLSLLNCINIAIKNNTKLFIAKEEYKLSRSKYKNLRRELFPKINLNYEEIDGTTTGEDFRGEGTKISMEYPLYTSGKLLKSFKQAKYNLSISKLKHNQIIIDLLTEVEKAYYIYQENLIKNHFTKELKETCKEALHIVKSLHKQGLARDIDLLEVEILTKEGEQKQKEIKSDIFLSEISLRQLLNYYKTPFNLSSNKEHYLINLDSKKLTKLALQNRVDIQLNKLLEKVNKYNKEIAKAENRLNIYFDGYMGRRAENFISEELQFENEYYFGITGKVPIGTNTVETKIIDQDTVPSAGQTTSTKFSSLSLKVNLFDNKKTSTNLEGIIKYHKSIEDCEKIKKTAIFEVQKSIIETFNSFNKLEISKEKVDLAEKKLNFQKMKLEKNETTVSDYVKEAISLFDAKTNYATFISKYYISVSNLNKSIGKPGYFNPKTGTKGKDYFEQNFNIFKNNIGQKSFFLTQKQNDPFYPKNNFDNLILIKD